jgi:hypothetical protein
LRWLGGGAAIDVNQPTPAKQLDRVLARSLGKTGALGQGGVTEERASAPGLRENSQIDEERGRPTVMPDEIAHQRVRHIAVDYDW